MRSVHLSSGAWTAGMVVLLAACGPEEPVPGDPRTEPGPPAPGAPEASPPRPPASPRDPGSPAPPPTDSPRTPPSPSEAWTAGIVDVPSSVDPGEGLPVVRELGTAVHEGHDRLTVELGEGRGMPGYHLEYVDRPLHQCGSGNPLHPVGDAWLELRLEPAQAHTESGQPTLEGRELPAVGEVAERIYLTCDFEGVVSLVLALRSPNLFRVFTLEDPRRLVLDVSH